MTNARRAIQQWARETQTKSAGTLEVKAGQSHTITDADIHFDAVTLRSGATLIIKNGPPVGRPARVEIDLLVLDTADAPATIRMFDWQALSLDGGNGRNGGRGADGYRQGYRNQDAVKPGNGRSGDPGEHGATHDFRGILFLKIDEIQLPARRRVITDKLLKIDAAGVHGGDGGNGGNGGNGGTGAPGRSGKHDCGRWGCRCSREVLSGTRGGNGGHGGAPGDGADGGDGGMVYLNVSLEDFRGLRKVVDLEGGEGGQGGHGGKPGKGGQGAGSVHGGGGHCGRRHAAMPRGNDGKDRSGETGANGSAGKKGELKRLRVFPSFAKILDQLLDSLAARGY